MFGDGGGIVGDYDNLEKNKCGSGCETVSCFKICQKI